MCFPTMKSVNFSQAHVVARASFSIWAYRRYMSDIDREAYATGFQVESNFWRITAPRPNVDASAEIFVGAEGSYRVSVVGFDSSCFTFRNTEDWVGPQVQDLDLLRSSHNGRVISASLRVNFPSWLAIPRNHLSCDTLVGGVISTIAFAFSGSAVIPFALITWPRKVSFSLLNSHFCGLRVTPAFSIHISAALSCSV